MADCRLILSLIIQGYSYRQIEAMVQCSHRAIAKAHTVVKNESLTTTDQVDALTVDDLDRLFTDGRRSTDGDFVPIDVDAVINARIGRKKPPLKVLWARYLNTPAPLRRRGITGMNGSARSLPNTSAPTTSPARSPTSRGIRCKSIGQEPRCGSPTRSPAQLRRSRSSWPLCRIRECSSPTGASMRNF